MSSDLELLLPAENDFFRSHNMDVQGLDAADLEAELFCLRAHQYLYRDDRQLAPWFKKRIEALTAERTRRNRPEWQGG